MRIPRRYIIGANSTFHKVWRCHNREHLLRRRRDKLAYLQAIHDDYMTKCTPDDFVIHSYNSMGNHGHELESIRRSQEAFSRHMQRAHGIFGLRYNKRYGRLGKFAHGRPKTLRIENDTELMRCAFYIDCNAVRAGIVKHPTDELWKDFSSCRYYCTGKKNRFDDMITFPDWYLRLGKTWALRRRKYRSLLDRYMVEAGMKHDPRMSSGLFLGSQAWVDQMRQELREKLGRRSDAPPVDDG